MTQPFRKLGAKEFKRRVRRVDPAYALFGEAANRNDTTYRRPGLSWMFGVGWLYALAYVATQLESLSAQITKSPLPQGLHFPAQALVVIFLAVSVVALAAQGLRALLSRGARGANARALAIGALCGLALFATPTLWLEEARNFALDFIATQKAALLS